MKQLEDYIQNKLTKTRKKNKAKKLIAAGIGKINYQEVKLK